MEILLESSTIRNRVAEIGKQVSADFAAAAKPPIVVCVLKGSSIFFADLIREITIPVNIAFIGVSSYAGGTQSSGAVQLTQDININIEGRDVILIEDIVDTGLTMSYLLEMIGARHPNRLQVCTLLHKPSRKKTEVRLDYVGFVIEDRFVVGYGMDFNEEHRNLPDIRVIE